MGSGNLRTDKSVVAEHADGIRNKANALTMGGKRMSSGRTNYTGYKKSKTTLEQFTGIVPSYAEKAIEMSECLKKMAQDFEGFDKQVAMTKVEMMRMNK